MCESLECTTCEGSGKIVEEACYTGLYPHSATWYDCEDCDGTGKILAPFDSVSETPA